MNIPTLWLRKFNIRNPLRKKDVSPEFQTWEPCIDQLPEKFPAISTTIYKSRNEIKIWPTKRGNAVIKSFGKIYLANRLIYAWLRPSKAKRSFDNAILLRDKGITTPDPVAYIECYRLGMIRESMYIYLYCPVENDMRKVLTDENFPDRHRLLKEFARFTFLLNKKQVYHRDYSPGNILFEKQGEHYHFTLIDINRIDFGEVDKHKKYKVFERLFTNEETLAVIAKEYARLYQEDEAVFAQKVIAHNRRFARKKMFKKLVKRKLHIS